MRQTIKLENGGGWSVRGREIRGMNKTQVTYRFQDGLGMKNPRSAVFLPYDWTSRNQSKVITPVADLKRLVDERNLSLKEAAMYINDYLCETTIRLQRIDSEARSTDSSSRSKCLRFPRKSLKR